MRAAGPEISRRPSIVPSLKLTEAEREIARLRAADVHDSSAPSATDASAVALDADSSRLPGAADELEDAAPVSPRGSFAVATAAAAAAAAAVAPPPLPAATPALAFEPFRGRWHYGQPVLARYRNTASFYSGNIATYLGAGRFMIVLDDGTLDYRVRREDLMIVASEDLSTDTLAPPGQQLMVDFSASPPRQAQLPADGGFAGRREDEQDALYARFSDLRPVGESTEPNALDVELPPSVPDDTAFMKQLENGVAFEEDSTQVSDSDDDEDDEDDGGELVTPWQQMTQTFGMARTLRPRATRRSSVSSVSQVERLSARLTKQASLKPSLLPRRSFKQMLSDYMSKHSKKISPSALQRGAGGVGADGGSGAPLSLHDLLEDMLMRLDAFQRDGEPTAVPPQRVVYTRRTDGVRAYGSIKARLASGEFAVVTEDEQMVAVQALAPSELLLLPSPAELLRQARSLARDTRELYAGRRVQVTLYPGTRFAGNGVVVVEKRESADPEQPTFHVLLQNRIRLHNVPADQLVPLTEKPRGEARAAITDEQFLVCSNKTKVFIGDQVLVKCAGDADGSTTEEKLGVLNGVYSNRTAAIDFADGSTGYEVLPHRISKRKKPRYPKADQDVLSLKNAVLMSARNGGMGGNSSGSSAGGALASPSGLRASRDADLLPPLGDIEEGYQVLADHPRRATVERCVVIKTHASSACDLRFADGTIAFEVFPTQMLLEGGGHLERRRKIRRRRSRRRPRRRSSQSGDETEDDDDDEWDEWTPRIGEYVLAWSSRFGRFCSAKVSCRVPAATTPASSTGSSSTAASSSSALFSIVFDYGEQHTSVPVERLTRIDDTDVLLPTQKLTNYSIDAMGFELWPVDFSVGEAVMARIHGSAIYFPGVVECVCDSGARSEAGSSSNASGKARRGSAKNRVAGPRVCGVLFDSGERDPCVPFTSIFSVDPRARILHSASTQASNARGSSSSGKGLTTKPHAGAGLVSNGMTIALGLGLSGVAIASNDPLEYQTTCTDGGGGGGGSPRITPTATTSAPFLPTSDTLVMPSRRTSAGSVSGIIAAVTTSFFGGDDASETSNRRASTLLTELGSRLLRRRRSS